MLSQVTQLFIIYGFGKTTSKNYGSIGIENCTNCNNQVHKQLLKVRTWFTLFFIPIIPYRTRYLSICPICGKQDILGKAQFMSYAEGVSGNEPTYQSQVPPQASASPSADDKYAGKNETQINFLKQMEENETKKREIES